MSQDGPKSHRSLGMTARGGARSAILAQVSVQLGSALATVILARILVPAEFGIIALAQSLMGVASLVSLAGITAAIVTHKGDTKVKTATYFWVALGVGGAFAAFLTGFGAPLVSALGQPNAAPYVAILSLNLPLSLMTLTPQALLQKRLEFTRMNAVTVVGAMVYFILEVVFALLGWGAWAVILGQVLGSATSLVVSMALARWLPSALPRLSHIRDDFSLVANMGVGAFFTYLSKNADYWAVSKTLGAGPLGIYYIAYVLPSIVRVRLSGIFRQIMLPLISGLGSVRGQTAAWGRATRVALSLALPAMVGIAAVADPLVGVLFGEKWSDAVLPMKLITVAGLADILIQAVGTMAIARRKHVSRTTVLVALRAGLIGGGALGAAALGYGLSGVALAVLAASVGTLVVQELWISRPLGIGFKTLGSEPLRVLFAAGVMFLIVELSLFYLSLTPFPQAAQLAVGVLIGLVAYTLVAWIVAKEALVDSLLQLRGMITRS